MPQGGGFRASLTRAISATLGGGGRMMSPSQSPSQQNHQGGPNLGKYRMMLKAGIPEGAVQQAMTRDGIDERKWFPLVKQAAPPPPEMPSSPYLTPQMTLRPVDFTSAGTLRPQAQAKLGNNAMMGTMASRVQSQGSGYDADVSTYSAAPRTMQHQQQQQRTQRPPMQRQESNRSRQGQGGRPSRHQQPRRDRRDEPRASRSRNPSRHRGERKEGVMKRLSNSFRSKPSEDDQRRREERRRNGGGSRPPDGRPRRQHKPNSRGHERAAHRRPSDVAHGSMMDRH